MNIANDSNSPREVLLKFRRSTIGRLPFYFFLIIFIVGILSALSSLAIPGPVIAKVFKCLWLISLGYVGYKIYSMRLRGMMDFECTGEGIEISTFFGHREMILWGEVEKYNRSGGKATNSASLYSRNHPTFMFLNMPGPELDQLEALLRERSSAQVTR